VVQQLATATAPASPKLMPMVPRVTTLRVRPVIPESVPQQALPTVQIVSQRSEADVLAVFRRLQEEQPSLFGQATLKRINIVGGAKPTDIMIAVNARLDLERMIYTAQVGPFESVKDAVAACRVLQAAADIRCLGLSGLK